MGQRDVHVQWHGYVHGQENVGHGHSYSKRRGRENISLTLSKVVKGSVRMLSLCHHQCQAGSHSPNNFSNPVEPGKLQIQNNSTHSKTQNRTWSNPWNLKMRTLRTG